MINQRLSYRPHGEKGTTMKKSDLRTGMRVTLRNGRTYYVMLSTDLAHDQKDVLVRKVGDGTGWMSLCQYDSDMCYHEEPDDTLPSIPEKNDRMWDIVKVESVRKAGSLFMPQDYLIIWERKE